MKKALITKITGQDGSYLAEFLLFKGYEVHGIVRRSSSLNRGRIDHLYQDPHIPDTQFFLHNDDLADSEQLSDLIYNVKPDEIYHLGAQSHVRVSFDLPEYTSSITGLGTTRLLKALRRSGFAARFYQASSSEMFGATPLAKANPSPSIPEAPTPPLRSTPTRWPATTGKAITFSPTKGILFNHESPRRGETFVTRKITRTLARIKSDKEKFLYLGNLDAKRDWGSAPEYVEVIWLILQQDAPDDYVIGTGESHAVREFVVESFAYAGLDWEKYVKIDAKYYRPTEVEVLRSDASKARARLDWQPRVSFQELVWIMIDYDLETEGLARESLSWAKDYDRP
jgi:GDPmannose 4,6-dehydratase